MQFGIRAILGVTAAFAVFAAAAAPALRTWSASERQAFLVVWATALLTVIGFVGVFCWLRLRAERRAGRVCFVLPELKARRSYMGAVLMCVLMIGLLAVMARSQQQQAHLFAEMNKQGGPIRFSPLWSVPTGISFGLPLAILGTALWWRTFRVELCEHGIIYFVSFVPWSSVSYKFEDGGALVTLRIALDRGIYRLRAVVLPELQETVRDSLRSVSQALD